MGGHRLYDIRSLVHPSGIHCMSSSPFVQHPVEHLDGRRLHVHGTLPQPQRVAVAHLLVGHVDVVGRRHRDPAFKLVVRFLWGAEGQQG